MPLLAQVMIGGTPVATGTFNQDLSEQRVMFARTVGRYVRLVALSEVSGGAWTSVAELKVVGASP